MKLSIVKEYRDEDLSVLKRAIRSKYGRIEKVKKQLQIKKCAAPGVGEAYLYYLGIDEGIEEEIIIEDKKVLNALTAKRFELLEFLNEHGPLSIKELANRTKRDYKNVYDDISALSRFLVLTVVKFGREKVPIGKILEIRFRL